MAPFLCTGECSSPSPSPDFPFPRRPLPAGALPSPPLISPLSSSQVLVSSGLLDPIQQAQLEQLSQRVEDAAMLAQEQDSLLEGVDVREGWGGGGRHHSS